MTHTYSRGCFKLIFRKCLPTYTSRSLSREYTHTRAHVDVLYRDRPPSRASAPSNDTRHPHPRLLLLSSYCFPTILFFPFSSFPSPLFLAPFPSFLLIFLSNFISLHLPSSSFITLLLFHRLCLTLIIFCYISSLDISPRRHPF